MKCPACESLLSKFTAGTVEIDVCKDGCAGIWFDRDELYQLDDANEGVGSQIFDLKPKLPATVAEKTCPRCPQQILAKQFLDAKNQVQIDQCWSCSGVWMDHGELQKIRSQFTSPQERELEANSVASAALDQLKDALQAKLRDNSSSEAEEKNRRAAWFVGKFLGIKELLDDFKKR